MQNDKNKLFLFFVLILLVVPLSSAQQFYPLPDSDKPFSFEQLFDLQTVVNGATCTSFPSDAGYTSGSSKLISCPSTLAGCSVVTWYGYYSQFASEFNLNPGDVDILGQEITYELYPCPISEVQCLCEGERDGGCGGGSCPATLMQRTRSCDPDSCSWTSTCVVRNECAKDACVPNWDCSTYSQCTSQGVQSRRCIDLNVCGINAGKPVEVQSCAGPGPGPDDPPPPNGGNNILFIIGAILVLVILGLFFIGKK